MQLKVYLNQRFFTFPTSAFPRLITFTRRDFLSRLFGTVVSIWTPLITDALVVHARAAA